MLFTRIDDISLGVRARIDVTKETGKEVESDNNSGRNDTSQISTFLTILRAKFLEYSIILNIKKIKNQKLKFVFSYIKIHSSFKT